MKIIERYILDEVKKPILFGISLFTFIFLIEIIVSLMESIIVKGISLIDVLRILSFYLPPILSQTIPMGIFLGIMITFSKFTRSSEITAMQSMGLGLKQILKPIVGLSIIAMIFIFFLQESIIPRSFERLKKITVKIAYENPIFQLKERIIVNEIGKYSLYIDKINKENNRAENILIFEKKDKGEYPTILLGNSAYWKHVDMILEKAKFYSFDKDGKLKLDGQFKQKKIPLNSYFKNIDIEVKDIEAMSISTLISKYRDKKILKKLPYKVEINRKLAIPLSTVALAILGVLLSSGHHRTGKGASFGISLAVIFIYIVLLNVGVVISNRGLISPYIGVWTPNVILFVGTILLYRKKAGDIK